MTPTERPISHKVLLVDDDDAIRNMMTATLEHKGFDDSGSETDHRRELRCFNH